MIIPYPNKPWVNGQEFTYTTPGGSNLSALYTEVSNSWSFKQDDAEAYTLAVLGEKIEALEQQITVLMNNQS